MENSRILNNSLNTQVYSKNYNIESNNINNYQNNYSIYNESEKIIIKFQSIDQSIKKEIECYENELFRDVVDKLINKCPKLVGKSLTFLANGSNLDKSISVKENKLTNGLIVLINIVDDNNFESSQENNYLNSNNISFSNYDDLINTNNNYINNENNFSPNQIISDTTTTSSYDSQSEIPYRTQISNSYIDNTQTYTTSPELMNVVPTIGIDSVPQYYNYQTTTTTAIPISVVPTATTVNINPSEENNSQINSNNNSISVVPAVNVYPIPQINDINQINANTAPISVVPTVNIMNPISYNNTFSTTTSSNQISVVPNVILSPIPVSVVPHVSIKQNFENDDF